EELRELLGCRQMVAAAGDDEVLAADGRVRTGGTGRELRDAIVGRWAERRVGGDRPRPIDVHRVLTLREALLARNRAGTAEEVSTDDTLLLEIDELLDCRDGGGAIQTAGGRRVAGIRQGSALAPDVGHDVPDVRAVHTETKLVLALVGELDGVGKQ